jgi:ankyrin repeat protein
MNRTPLHYAMGLSNEDIITLLLAHDADTTVKDVVCTDL